ncbi:GntR family transcriptional regulator [Brevibacillus formosus]|uniref:GntR family transcriptional regulator n=1 Tax=Brevibacillus formosus TaxID=54913 RepID=A0A837KQU9_9BACL|nr:GntR family transcriptional regulator [Brevibacillus formosus]KLI00099.1 GntR family transcriptional regulator [Brevibacillus formosus]MED1959310.1 GntR family transcriptional regulator [Brevibacillus formosus]PSJ96166.1 GntR family transcriptional regulator [Brevibacillus formosus]GED56534.1 GntR family transcriptional regulator [Brevibacillus formosus]
MDTNLIKQIERPTLREQVYQGLKKAIIMLELKPGQRVNDNELAALFGVSRTPVREALKRLEDEGLIESVPGSLTRVTPLLEKEAKHAFPVVAALHGVAARLSMPFEREDICSLEQWNEKLRVALEQQDVIKAIEADDGFHDVILEAAGNREIYLALERVVPKVRRLEFARFGSLEGGESVKQHSRIIEAFRDNNSQLASSLVEENWISLGRLLTDHSNDE